MGVNITIRPGTIMKCKGEETDITPGWRSRAATVLCDIFPCYESKYVELDQDDEATLKCLSAGAYVYTDDNMWKKILEMLREHGSVVVAMNW